MGLVARTAGAAVAGVEGEVESAIVCGAEGTLVKGRESMSWSGRGMRCGGEGWGWVGGWALRKYVVM